MNSWDFLGLLGFDTVLKQYRKRILAELKAGNESVATDLAYGMYSDMMIGGFLSGKPFSSKMLKQWLYAKGDYTMTEGEASAYVTDKNVVKMFFDDVEKNKIGMNMEVVSHRVNVWPEKQSDLFFAMNAGFIDFTGCIVWENDRPVSAGGVFNIDDDYNWNKGEYVTIHGVKILDDWAILVEKYKGAKGFEIDGSYETILFRDAMFNSP